MIAVRVWSAIGQLSSWFIPSLPLAQNLEEKECLQIQSPLFLLLSLVPKDLSSLEKCYLQETSSPNLILGKSL